MVSKPKRTSKFVLTQFLNNEDLNKEYEKIAKVTKSSAKAIINLRKKFIIYEKKIKSIEAQFEKYDLKFSNIVDKETSSEILEVETFNTAQKETKNSIKDLTESFDELNEQSNIINERLKKNDDLNDKFQKYDERLKEFETQLANFDEKKDIEPNASIEDKIDNTEEKLPVNVIIDKAITEEQEKMSEEHEVIKEAAEKQAHWIVLGKKMCSEIDNFKNKLSEIISKNKEILDAFPNDISSDLNVRHNGLALIGRMFDRLDISQIESIILTPDTMEKIQLTTKEKWEELLSDTKTMEDADKIISKHLKNQQMINFRIATKSKDSSDKIEKKLTGFVTSHIFPIVDGIFDGSKDVDHKKENLIQAHPGNVEEIKAWFDSYNHLNTLLVTLLKKINIHMMDINRGDSVDWSCHEAFSAEEDTELEDDTIKEIFRFGFEYETHDGKRQKLRTAQVVVVKNS